MNRHRYHSLSSRNGAESTARTCVCVYMYRLYAFQRNKDLRWLCRKYFFQVRTISCTQHRRESEARLEDLDTRILFRGNPSIKRRTEKQKTPGTMAPIMQEIMHRTLCTILSPFCASSVHTVRASFRGDTVRSEARRNARTFDSSGESLRR